MKDWCKKNYMTLNLPKTWEMVIHDKTSKPKPPPLQDIKTEEGVAQTTWYNLSEQAYFMEHTH